MHNINYIFVLGNHKSGTSLIRSMLDGHPDIVSIPIETHPFKHLQFPINYSMNKNIVGDKQIDRSSIINNFINWIKLNNQQKNSNFGGNYGYKKFDEEKFEDYLKNKFESCNDYKDLLELYLQGIIFSINSINISTVKYVVEKSVENFEYAETLAHYFNNCKFIHIIRNPYSNVVSLRKYHNVLAYGNVNYKNIIVGLGQSYYYFMRNKRLLQNYYTLRYEDLINNPENQMRKIADYLSIKYSNELCKPTILGESWKGNSTQFFTTGNIINNSEKWLDEITPFEIQLVNRYLMSDFHFLPYKNLVNNSFKAFFSQKFENFRSYIKNRILLYG